MCQMADDRVPAHGPYIKGATSAAAQDGYCSQTRFVDSYKDISIQGLKPDGCGVRKHT